jgi:hypothetical protein
MLALVLAFMFSLFFSGINRSPANDDGSQSDHERGFTEFTSEMDVAAPNSAQHKETRAGKKEPANDLSCIHIFLLDSEVGP